MPTNPLTCQPRGMRRPCRGKCRAARPLLVQNASRLLSAAPAQRCCCPTRLAFAAKLVKPPPLTLPADVRRCCDAATAFLKAKCQCDQTLLSALPPTVVTPAGLNGTLQVCTDGWLALALLVLPSNTDVESPGKPADPALHKHNNSNPSSSVGGWPSVQGGCGGLLSLPSVRPQPSPVANRDGKASQPVRRCSAARPRCAAAAPQRCRHAAAVVVPMLMLQSHNRNLAQSS